MQLLDSRASRMTPNEALLTLHADYLGGPHANYQQWRFAVQLDLTKAIRTTQHPGHRRVGPVERDAGPPSLSEGPRRPANDRQAMSQSDRLREIALYLLCWGEAAQVRFVPECLCFIFMCANDYYMSAECQSQIEPVPEGFYLQGVIKPLYLFIREQGYEVVEGKHVRREKDHNEIIGYDDVNQLFWCPEGIARIELYDMASHLSQYILSCSCPSHRGALWTCLPHSAS